MFLKTKYELFNYFLLFFQFFRFIFFLIVNVKVMGKKKKGGVKLKRMTPFVEILCDDSSKYIVYSNVQGFLLETNSNVVANPNLICEQVQSFSSC